LLEEGLESRDIRNCGCDTQLTSKEARKPETCAYSDRSERSPRSDGMGQEAPLCPLCHDAGWAPVESQMAAEEVR